MASPKKKNKKEIVSLNPQLYKDLSIEELEERLEMGCYINSCGDNCGTNSTCTTDICAADCNLCGGNCTCLGDIGICNVDVFCLDAV